MPALGIDVAHQPRQVEIALVRNRSQFVPEHIFQADTGLVTTNHQRSFNDPRLEMIVAIVLLEFLARPIVASHISVPNRIGRHLDSHWFVPPAKPCRNLHVPQTRPVSLDRMTVRVHLRWLTCIALVGNCEG